MRRKFGDDPRKWPEKTQEVFQSFTAYLPSDLQDEWLKNAISALQETEAGRRAREWKELRIGTRYPDEFTGEHRRKQANSVTWNDDPFVAKETYPTLGPGSKGVRWTSNADFLKQLESYNDPSLAPQIDELRKGDLWPDAGHWYEIDEDFLRNEEWKSRVTVARMRQKAKEAEHGSSSLGTGASQAIGDAQALMARVGEKYGYFEPGAADLVTQDNMAREAALDEMNGHSEWARNMRGAGRSLTNAALAATAGKPLGMFAAPALNGATTANESYVSARLAGKSEQEAKSYALNQARAEAIITLAFSLVAKAVPFFRGAKPAAGQIGREVQKSLVRRGLKYVGTVGWDLLEENVVALGSAWLDVAHDMDPHALDRDKLLKRLWETTKSTLVTIAAAEGARGAKAIHELHTRAGDTAERGVSQAMSDAHGERPRTPQAPAAEPARVNVANESTNPNPVSPVEYHRPQPNDTEHTADRSAESTPVAPRQVEGRVGSDLPPTDSRVGTSVRNAEASSAGGRASSDSNSRAEDGVDTVNAARARQSLIERWNSTAAPSDRIELSREYYDLNGRRQTMTDAQAEFYRRVTDDTARELIEAHNFDEGETT